MNNPQSDAKLIQLLLSRLERISADSYWAHRASGMRGSLLKLLEQIETNQTADANHVKCLMKCGFEILNQTAREKARNRMRYTL